MPFDEIKSLLDNDKAVEARKVFDSLPHENTVEFYFLKGRIEQKYQHWGPAINAFNRVLELDPENEDAKNNLALIRDILNFWNPDMLNP